MPRAVRYDEFGGIDVLRVDEEAAGGLYVVGVTAWGTVHAVEPRAGRPDPRGAGRPDRRRAP
jgi:hypothetical protein